MCCTFTNTLLNHVLGNRGLSLPQRESMEVTAHARGLSQLHQGSCWVHTRRQDKDQRSPAAGFFHNLEGDDRDLRVKKQAERKQGETSQRGETTLWHCELESHRMTYRTCTNHSSQNQYLVKYTGKSRTNLDTHGLHVENRWLHKARAKVVNNERRDAEGDAVRT